MANQPKRYRLLTGAFYARFEERAQRDQPQPDGDTIRFVPDNPFPFFDPAQITRYGYADPDLTNYGISVRFEGIDTLETHFAKNGSPVVHQDPVLGQAARDFMLAAVGFQDVVFDTRYPNTVKSVRDNPVRGFVIANGVEQNGRLLGFVYAGDPDGIPEYDRWRAQPPPSAGSRPALPPAIPVFLDRALLEKSVNWQLIDARLAYAELYTSLPLDLGRHLARRVRALRQAPPPGSLWERETLAVGRSFVWDKRLASLSDSVMFPKLFRRLVEYGYEISALPVTRRPTFDAWLRDPRFARDRDDRLLLPPLPGNPDPPNCEFGNLHDIVAVVGVETRTQVELVLKHHPEDVVVLPDNV